MKEKISYLVFMIFVISCQKKDIEPVYPDIIEYKVTTMLYPTSIMPPSSMIKLLYNSDNKIVKRIGALIEISSFTGFNYKIIERTADSIVYRQNAINTKQLFSYFGPVNKNLLKRELIFENDRLVKKINEGRSTSLYDNDTTLYTYNSINEIIKMNQYSLHNIIHSKLSYDERGNLKLITSETFSRYDYKLIYLDTITFSNYDNTPNLTKKLIIFEECFFRSLSTNNFADYSYKQYNTSKTLVSMQKRSWQLKYDENNYLIY